MRASNLDYASVPNNMSELDYVEIVQVKPGRLWSPRRQGYWQRQHPNRKFVQRSVGVTLRQLRRNVTKAFRSASANVSLMICLTPPQLGLSMV